MTLELKLGFWLSLMVVVAAEYTIELKDNGTMANSTMNLTLTCNNSDLKEHMHELVLLNAAIENLRLKMDMYDTIEVLPKTRAFYVNTTQHAPAWCMVYIEFVLPWRRRRLQREFGKQTGALLRDTKNYMEERQFALSPLNSSKSLVDHRSCSARVSSSFNTVSQPSTCTEALSTGSPSGIYQLYLPNEFGLKPFYVYCQQDNHDGGAWTIIQRRQDKSTNFNRVWKDYKNGFGDINTNYWIGLDRLHALTHARMNELRIDMEDFEKVTRFAVYDRFAIADESSLYELSILGNFSGDAGDSLRDQATQKFSARDKDNDEDRNNCAANDNAGWWYKSCAMCNLNGVYTFPRVGADKTGIFWNGFGGKFHFLKYVYMAIRPVELP